MNRKIIEKYLNPYNKNDSFISFNACPYMVAQNLPKIYGYLSLKEAQNESPTTEEMISIASKYKGTLEGYVITLNSGRPDARITFDGFTIPVCKSTAYKLKNNLNPSEFDASFKPHGWRFWWD